MATAASITQLLTAWSNGNREALDELTPHVYRELHHLAQAYLKRIRPKQTLPPTALINEVYLRLIDQSKPIRWQDRSHFYSIAARLMRNILVDHARAQRALKRGGGAITVGGQEMVSLSTNQAPDVISVDQGLMRLARVDERKAQVIEMRYFGGMNREEIACALGLSVATVKRDLRLGEAWLRRDLMGSPVRSNSGAG
jgi:RNA polymerase sigma factor (TIGR02999 family)